MWTHTMTIITVLFLCSVAYFGVEIVSEIQHLSQERYNQSEELSYKNRLLNPSEWLGQSAPNTSSMVKLTTYVPYKKIISNILKVAYIILGYLVIVSCLGWLSGYWQASIIGITLIATLLLVGGTTLPMIEIRSFESDLSIPLSVKVPLVGNFQANKTFGGDIVFFYQSKSIIGVIQVLLSSQNYLTAGLIILFSIIIPTLKMLLATIAVVRKSVPLAQLANHSLLAKLSWCDVLVVAIWLSILAFQETATGIKTEAVPLIGYYMFMAYCTLSLLMHWPIKVFINKMKTSHEEYIY